METISLKLEKEFLEDIEKAMKRYRYSTKTEFIRESIRNKIYELKKEEALLQLKRNFGISKRKTDDKRLHEARERAFAELAK